ncbi:MAG: ubiquinone/menaquinone biosynthesis methyltransferase [Phycisphaerales bacterium]|nr:ubiquinone/menaquinone biosynthesis methyltransferase [Phycisphaerales bacterium]
MQLIATIRSMALTGTKHPQHDQTAWDDAALRNPHRAADKAARVEAMFDAIATSYERVNTLATFGQDARWRARAIAATRPTRDDIVLDIACGTGDMLRAFLRHAPRPARVIGLDFSEGMLSAGAYGESSSAVRLLRGDGTRLPLRDASVDVVTCAFGVRNFQRLDDGLREMRRVLRRGGRCAILEFATPENSAMRWMYEQYCRVVLPALGSLVSRDRSGAYRYLPKSIETFDTPPMMERRLIDAGFATVQTRLMNFGGVALYLARIA